MTARDRVKKPTLPRTRPNRSWSGLLGPDLAPESEAAAGDGAEEHEGAQGVDLGYRVIDEYLKVGRRAAARTSGPTNPSAAAGDPAQLTRRLAQYTSEMTQLWLEMLQAAVTRPGGSGGEVGQTAGPFTAPARSARDRAEPAAASQASPVAPAAAVQSPPLVSLDVSSHGRVEVSVDLRPARLGPRLVAHDLRCLDHDGARLRDVAVTYDPDGHRLSVRFHVPDELPPGTYSGLFVDPSDNLPRGSLVVRVFPR